MTRDKIEAARDEATRFLLAADEALTQLDRENSATWRRDPVEASPGDHSYGSAATGTLRRRSMDLTRALSELRK